MFAYNYIIVSYRQFNHYILLTNAKLGGSKVLPEKIRLTVDKLEIQGFHLAQITLYVNTKERRIMNSLCHQPNTENAAIYFFIHQSFNVFDGLIQSVRLRRQECTGVTF